MREKLFELLWECLDGGDYNLDAIKEDLGPDDQLIEFQIDSLDIVEFYVRIQGEYDYKIPQDDFPALSSISAIEDYLRSHVVEGGQPEATETPVETT